MWLFIISSAITIVLAFVIFSLVYTLEHLDKFETFEFTITHSKGEVSTLRGSNKELKRKKNRGYAA